MNDPITIEPVDENAPKIRKAKAVGLPDTTRIMLEENPDIPPTGLFIGLNGRGYILKPGEVADVPNPLISILDNAEQLMPYTDPSTNQIVGYRSRLRFPYRRVNS